MPPSHYEVTRSAASESHVLLRDEASQELAVFAREHGAMEFD